MCQERRRKNTGVDAELGTGAFGFLLQAALTSIPAFESKAGIQNTPALGTLAQHRTGSHSIAQSFP